MYVSWSPAVVNFRADIRPLVCQPLGGRDNKSEEDERVARALGPLLCFSQSDLLFSFL